jgi:hypothetical protein
MSIDPFTTPAEAEREARAKQAHHLLDAAQKADARPSYASATSLNYAGGVMAVRDAIVGQGYALLSVRDELADIAGSLRTLTALPGAVQWLGDHLSALDDTVGGGLAELTEAIHKHGSSVDDSSSAVVDAIRAHGEVLDSAVFGVVDVMDRPRWWQLRRRWTLWRLSKSLDNVTSAPDAAEPTQEESPAGVYEFMVQVVQDCPSWALADHEVVGCVRFYAETHAACETAGTMLPGLCAQLGVEADPARVHGLVYRCDPDPDEVEDGYVGAVFLPGATILDAPAGGF